MPEKYVTHRCLSGTGLTKNGIQILDVFRSSRRAISIREVAAMVKCSEKTVKRAIKDLENLGFLRVRREIGLVSEYEVVGGA
jgi:DNA-binding IclR family transcriptional regulator